MEFKPWLSDSESHSPHYHSGLPPKAPDIKEGESGTCLSECLLIPCYLLDDIAAFEEGVK